jgi:hypothetical protein
MLKKKKIFITADDLYKFKIFTDCKISPDCKHCKGRCGKILAYGLY